VKGESNRAGLHAKIAEPPPIFCKDSESREKTGTCSQFSEVHPIQDYVKDNKIRNANSAP